jgi:hypothetical protein
MGKDLRRLIFLFLLITSNVYSQEKFSVPVSHNFLIIDEELHDVLENDFALEGKTYPSVLFGDEKKLIITNPFIEDRYCYEYFSWSDSTSTIHCKIEIPYNFILEQLNIVYNKDIHRIKVLNEWEDGVIFFLFYNGTNCELHRMDLINNHINLIAYFDDVIKLSNINNNNIKLFNGGDQLVINNEVTQQNVIIELKEGKVYYKRTLDWQVVVGVRERCLLTLNQSTYEFFEQNYDDKESIFRKLTTLSHSLSNKEYECFYNSKLNTLYFYYFSFLDFKLFFETQKI